MEDFAYAGKGEGYRERSKGGLNCGDHFRLSCVLYDRRIFFMKFKREIEENECHYYAYIGIEKN